MISRRNILTGAVAGLALLVAARRIVAPTHALAAPPEGGFAVTHSDAEWRAMLSPAAYDVLRHEGTERPYSSALLDEHRQGTFTCAGCQQDAFDSATKFDSGTGWPSFFRALDKAVIETRDTTFGMERTAVSCSRCGGHLGHVFDDGPRPTGLRYCMNGVALGFRASAA